MATITSHLRQIERQLELLLPAEEILQACRAAGYRFRIRVLNPAFTVQLLILQLLAHSSMRGLKRVADLKITRQAIAQARARLPLQLMLRLVETLCQRALGLVEGDPDWRGHRLVLVDGTSCRVDDTPALRKRFGKPSNQRGTSAGCPVIRLLAVLDYSSGMIRRIITMPYAQQEIKALASMFRYLKAGDLILADRGLISYAHVALMLKRKLCLCIRLPGSMVVHGRGRASHLKVKRLGKQDLLVKWLRVTHLSSRTVEGVRKELAAFVILYNLIRLTMLKSARNQNVTPDRISFIDAADWLLWSHYTDTLPTLEVNPIRRRKSQPRAIKDYRRNFGRLTRPRRQLERPPCEARL